METSFVLIVLLFAALATGGLIVNWTGLGRAIFRQERQTRGKPRRLVRRVPSSAIPVLATDNGAKTPWMRSKWPCRSCKKAIGAFWSRL